MPVVTPAPKFICDVCGQEVAHPISYHLYVASTGHDAVGAFGAEEEQVIACSGEHALQAIQERLQRLEQQRQAKIAAVQG